MATKHQTIDFARRRAIVTGNDILTRHIEGSMLYYEIFDYEHGDTSQHASIARSVICIALGTAAKLSLTKPPTMNIISDTMLYLDGKKICDLRDVNFKGIQMTVDGKTIIMPTQTYYIVIINSEDGRKIFKTENIETILN